MNALGQSNEREGEEISETTINLIESIDDAKTVILFENKNFTIKTSLNNFKENIDNWLIEHPGLISDKELLNLVLERANNNNIIEASIIAKNSELTSRLEYRIAALLESGQCLVLIKKENTQIVSEVKIQTYSYYCGPLCGDGGRRFYVNGILLMQVEDWIS